VVDADGLKLLVELEDWAKRLPPGSVLTPHPGEMAIMTGMPVEEIQAERRKTAAEHAEEWGHVVVLKGAFTIVAGPDGRQALLPFASSSLAKAGTGDVLAGVIVGLLGQGMDAYDAAVLGCWLHARAGQLAAEWYQSEAGVVAGELLDFLPPATSDLVNA
jgi:NAD(P)H-hydrate epimerase